MSAPLELVDIGVNLTDRAFAADRDAVIARALEQGVSRMVLTGTGVAESRAASELARGRPGVLWSTAGVHPHYARSCGEDTLPALRELLREPQVVAVGECGLDFVRDLSPRPVQEQWFEAQVQLAGELRRPLFVHDREANERVRPILAAHRGDFAAAVVHCFTGELPALRGYLDLDLHIGVTGWICDERRGLHLRELVRYVPADRLMLETDAPYLLPRTIRPRPRSRRNEPAFLPWVLDAVAEALGRPRAQVAAATTAVARAFFGLG